MYVTFFEGVFLAFLLLSGSLDTNQPGKALRFIMSSGKFMNNSSDTWRPELKKALKQEIIFI